MSILWWHSWWSAWHTCETRTPDEELPPSDWPVGLTGRHFLDCWFISKSLPTVGGIIPYKDSWGSQLGSSVPSMVLCGFLQWYGCGLRLGRWNEPSPPPAAFGYGINKTTRPERKLCLPTLVEEVDFYPCSQGELISHFSFLLGLYLALVSELLAS